MSDGTWYYSPKTNQLGCFVQYHAGEIKFCSLDGNESYSMNRHCDNNKNEKAIVLYGLVPIVDLQFNISLNKSVKTKVTVKIK